MFYVRLKNEWVEYNPSYIGEQYEKARLEKTLIPNKSKQNVKERRFELEQDPPELTAASVMSRDIIYAEHDSLLVDCHQLMGQNNIHHLIINREGQFTGIISDRDIKLIQNLKGATQLVADNILTTVIMATHESTPLGRVCVVLRKEEISSLPVLNDDLEVCGILTVRDLLKSFSSLIK